MNFHPESQNQTNTHAITGNVAGSLCRHKAFVARLSTLEAYHMCSVSAEVVHD